MGPDYAFNSSIQMQLGRTWNKLDSFAFWILQEMNRSDALEFHDSVAPQLERESVNQGIIWANCDKTQTQLVRGFVPLNARVVAAGPDHALIRLFTCIASIGPTATNAVPQRRFRRGLLSIISTLRHAVNFILEE